MKCTFFFAGHSAMKNARSDAFNALSHAFISNSFFFSRGYRCFLPWRMAFITRRHERIMMRDRRHTPQLQLHINSCSHHGYIARWPVAHRFRDKIAHRKGILVLLTKYTHTHRTSLASIQLKVVPSSVYQRHRTPGEQNSIMW